MGDMTYSVYANALRDAYRALDEARRARREAAHILATIRETLDLVFELLPRSRHLVPLTACLMRKKLLSQPKNSR